MRKVVLAQRDLDFHSRVGVAAEDLDDPGQRLAVRGGLLDQLGDDDLAGLRVAAHIRRHQDVLVDALVLGDEEPDAAVLVESANDLAVGVREHVDDRALGPATTVDADLTRGRAVAVQRLVHLLRRQKKIGTAVVGDEEAVAVGVALDRTRGEIELGDDAQLTLAIGHQLPVALHRAEPSRERIALRRAVYSERGRKIVGAHRRAVFAQMFEDLVAAWNIDVAVTTTRRASHCASRGCGVAARYFL